MQAAVNSCSWFTGKTIGGWTIQETDYDVSWDDNSIRPRYVHLPSASEHQIGVSYTPPGGEDTTCNYNHVEGSNTPKKCKLYIGNINSLFN